MEYVPALRPVNTAPDVPESFVTPLTTTEQLAGLVVTVNEYVVVPPPPLAVNVTVTVSTSAPKSVITVPVFVVYPDFETEYEYV